MSTATQRMTAEELWHLPRRAGERRELVLGELRTMTPAGLEHGGYENKLAVALTNHVTAHTLGLVVSGDPGFVLAKDPDTVRAPDVAFLSQALLRAKGISQSFFQGAPDLAAEIVSPNDRVHEIDEKVEDWLRAGCKLVWVINPRRKEVTVHGSSTRPVILTEADGLDGKDIVPGFRLRIADLFTLP